MKKILLLITILVACVFLLPGVYAQEEAEGPGYGEGPQCHGPVCDMDPQGRGPGGSGGPQGDFQKRGRGPDKEKMFEKIVEELGLTDEQQEALRGQRAEHGEKIRTLMEDLRSKKTQLRAELEKTEIDRAKIDGIIEQIKPLLGRQIELRVEDTLAMKEILTPEQYQKFHEFIKKKMGHGKRGFGRRGHQGFKKRGAENEGPEDTPEGGDL